MDINFTGITNLQISKSRAPKTVYGLYPSVTGELKQGEKVAREYRLRFNLSGKDFDDFFMAMSKSEKGLNSNYFKNDPNKFELLMTRYDIDDDIAKTSFNVFRINNENVTLTQRCGLALYEHLAHLTRRFIEDFNLSDKQRNLMKFINQSIHDDAVEFIETM